MINTKPKGKAILTQEQFKNLTTPVPNREYHIVIKEGGTTAERPISPDLYQMYYDTTLSALMIWNGTAWVQQSNIALTKAQVEAVLTGSITSHTHNPAQVNTDANNRFVTDTEKSTWNDKQDKLVAGDNITIDENTNMISASGGEVDLNVMAYFNYAGSIYGAKYSLLVNAWEHSLTIDPNEISVNSTTEQSRGTAQYPDGDTEGVIIPHGVTSIGTNAFRDWTSNNQPLVIPNSVTSIGNWAFLSWSSNNHPLIIPDSVTSIGSTAFYGWSSNNQPLIISDSVISIVNGTFQNWTSNNQSLVIPDSVTDIRSNAFRDWTSNNHPLIIPDSVTDIGTGAFRNWHNVLYVEMKRSIPPTLANAVAFAIQNDAPIYVPDASVNAYKTATNWLSLASRIFGISTKP